MLLRSDIHTLDELLSQSQFGVTIVFVVSISVVSTFMARSANSDCFNATQGRERGSKARYSVLPPAVSFTDEIGLCP